MANNYYLHEWSKSGASQDGPKLASCSRQAMTCGSNLSGEGFTGDDKGRGVGATVAEEEREAVEDKEKPNTATVHVCTR